MIPFLETLIPWFYTVREPYFFRENRTPYRVWVCEVALQQTRIQAALLPLARFLERFPDVRTLADATETEVLQAFSGLGYYARGRNLHNGARYILEKYDGLLPQTVEKLCQIPSIGPYTAAAISSICYGAKNPVVDGNVKRILSRFCAWETPIASSASTQAAYRFLTPLFAGLSQYPAGDANEAMMELGQKVCTKNKPTCTVCPINTWCQAFQKHMVACYPRPATKPEKIPVIWHLYLFQNGQGQMLMQQWRDFYFLKGHLGFPSLLEFSSTGQWRCSWHPDGGPDTYAQLGSITQKLPAIAHAITRHKIKIYPYLGNAKLSLPANVAWQWVDTDTVSKLLVPSALRKVWQSAAAKMTCGLK